MKSLTTATQMRCTSTGISEDQMMYVFLFDEGDVVIKSPNRDEFKLGDYYVLSVAPAVD